ncbi:Thiol-disulfide oxidoreductase ResA [uncultured archaeon]|nr:Thiol-disulfide oxidoreductase ResA [uncultured archaeon]
MFENKKAILATVVIGVIAGFLVYGLSSGGDKGATGSLGSVSGDISFRDAVGQKAPDFSLESINGKTVKLSDYRGKNVVLFFTEGSMCYPACWDQMAEFANDNRFNSDSVVVFSITPDPKSEWEKIIQQVPKLSGAKILFDTTKVVSSSYDVLNLPSSMHKGSFPGHTYFIVDKEGVIRYSLDDPRMSIQNDKLADELKKLA